MKKHSDLYIETMEALEEGETPPVLLQLRQLPRVKKKIKTWKDVTVRIRFLVTHRTNGEVSYLNSTWNYRIWKEHFKHKLKDIRKLDI